MLTILLMLADDDIGIVTSLYETQNKRMYNIAFKILNKPEDAEEALYEAFLRIMDNIERIKGLPYSARAPFCATIVKNISKNMLRGKNLQLGFYVIKENGIWKQANATAASPYKGTLTGGTSFWFILAGGNTGDVEIVFSTTPF